MSYNPYTQGPAAETGHGYQPVRASPSPSGLRRMPADWDN